MKRSNIKKVLLALILSPIILFVYIAFDEPMGVNSEKSNPRTGEPSIEQQYKDKWEKESQPKRLEKTEFEKVLEKHTKPNSK